jgi:excisionase family DNA binding protein
MLINVKSTRRRRTNDERTAFIDRRIAFSIFELAQLTGASRSFIRLEIERGRLHASKVGGRVLILRKSVDDWLGL